MSIKKNFFYNSILTLSSYVFPLITFPYTSRVIGVENIGICNFVDSIISYFTLFSMMGISTCGIREIAANRHDKEKLSHTYSSLITLNAITTCLALILLYISIFAIPQLRSHYDLLIIGSCKLLCNLLMAEWLFKGLEDFPYITKRVLIIKCIYVVSIFVFIHSASDYKIYYTIIVLSVVFNALFNQVYARKFVRFSLKNIQIKKYVKTFIIIGVYSIITSMYTSFNTTWLGIATDTTQVGYYSTAIKLHLIIIGIFTAFTNVMLPRMTSLIAENKEDEFKKKIKQSVEALFVFCFPTVVYAIIFGPLVLHLLTGDGYEGSYLPFRIIVPLLFICGYEQILVLQILMPLKKDKQVLINSIVGALVGIILNVTLVPLLGAIGSSIVWVSSEMAVFLLSLYWVSKTTKMSFPYKNFAKNTICYFPLFFIFVLIYRYVDLSEFFKLMLSFTLLAIYVILIQRYCLKNELVIQSLYRIKNNFIKINGEESK